VDHEDLDPRLRHGLHALGKPPVGLLPLEAQAHLHRHGDADGLPHGLQDLLHPHGVQEEAGPIPTFLGFLRGAAQVEVDLVVAESLADPRRLRQALRVPARKLEG